MGLGWTPARKLAFHNSWYNCDNGSSKGVKFRQPCSNYEVDGLVVDSAGGGYWIGWMGIVVESGRWEEVGTWLGMLEMGEVVCLVDRWERAEHMNTDMGSWLHETLFYCSHFFYCRNFSLSSLLPHMMTVRKV